MKKYFFCLTFGLFVAMGVCNAQTPKVTPLEFKETVDNNGSGGEGDRSIARKGEKNASVNFLTGFVQCAVYENNERKISVLSDF